MGKCFVRSKLNLLIYYDYYYCAFVCNILPNCLIFVSFSTFYRCDYFICIHLFSRIFTWFQWLFILHKITEHYCYFINAPLYQLMYLYLAISGFYYSWIRYFINSSSESLLVVKSLSENVCSSALFLYRSSAVNRILNIWRYYSIFFWLLLLFVSVLR